jgi:hypothetical protein
MELILSFVYDPSNGTASAGEIVRVGGATPPGRQWSAFFQAILK